MKSFLFFVTVFILSASSQQAQAVGPTYVKDNIAMSSSWTKENSPYVIQNDIIISKGAVLTIDPGVEVRFVAVPGGKVGAGPNLVVQGGLKAVGNTMTPISFAPSVTGSLWGAIYFAGSDPANSTLQGCMIKGGRIAINSASPTITQCAIFGAKTGVEVYGNSQPQIIGNRITGNGIGLSLFAATANPVVSGNEIYNNNYGFYFRDFGNPSITNNKIHNNLKYNIVNYSAKPVNVPNNDFQSADALLIARTIYDGAANASLGRVTYSPFVGMAAGQMAPTGTVAAAASDAAKTMEKPAIQDDEFWGYGRPFDGMKISNVEDKKKSPSNTVKILAVGATAVVTVALLFL